MAAREANQAIIPPAQSAARGPLRYEVRFTRFHASDPDNALISRHRTREAAVKVARRIRRGECVCGCAVVIDRDCDLVIDDDCLDDDW